MWGKVSLNVVSVLAKEAVVGCSGAGLVLAREHEQDNTGDDGSGDHPREEKQCHYSTLYFPRLVQIHTVEGNQDALTFEEDPEVTSSEFA